MVSVPVQCPYCQSTAVIKAGKPANGTQRYQCQNGRCVRRIFLLQYQDRGRIPDAAKWSTWHSMAVVSATPPVCCGSVPRP
jgi:transposase-like protein